MQDYLLRAPSWVVGVFTGGFFGLVMGVIAWFEGVSVGFAALTALVAGVLFGTTFALATRSQRRRFRSAVEQVPQSAGEQVRRAAWRGPVPTDPAVRSAALDLADHSYRRLYRYRWWIYGIFGFNFVLGIFNIVVGNSLWHIVALVGWTGAVTSHWYSLRRLPQRIALLQ